MEGMAEEKLYFLLLKLVKRKKCPVLGKVSQLILLPIVALGSFNLYCCTCSAQERLDESLKTLKAQVDLKLSGDVSGSDEGK